MNLDDKISDKICDKISAKASVLKTKESDIRVKEVKLYFLPVKTRVPLKFGP